ncbi:MAG: pilus assembly protein N-terminal domain-containing protein [Hyphomicrobiaceae bacterium]
MCVTSIGRSIAAKAAISVVIACAFATTGVAPAAAADDLIVKYDQSQILRMPSKVSEFIIGNPTIADVSIQSTELLVVTGKSFGITNVIALDSERKVIHEARVIVVRDEVRVVNLQKGSKRESYNCTPQCNPSLVVGDDQTYFDGVVRASERKIRFSEGQADQSQAAQNQ